MTKEEIRIKALKLAVQQGKMKSLDSTMVLSIAKKFERYIYSGE